jgi:hypothetical protein
MSIYFTNVSFIPFLVFGHFWQLSYENTKILRNLCLHFARQDGQDGKKPERNHTIKVIKIPKAKRRNLSVAIGFEIKANLER